MHPLSFRSPRPSARLRWLCSAAVALSCLLAPAAPAAVLEQVIDLVAQNTVLSLGFDGTFFSQGTSDGRITVVVRENSGITLFKIYQLDPTAGTSVGIATIDPTLAKPNPSAFLPILGLDGTVYLVIEDFNLAVQQDLYRVEGATLVHVLDLTAQGIELPLFGSATWAGASSDGVLRVVHLVAGLLSNQYHVVEIDPSVPSAVTVSNLQTASDFPVVMPAFAPAGEVYFLIEELVGLSATERTQKLFRVDGNAFVELADIGQAGFWLGIDPMTNTPHASVSDSGVLRVVTRDGFAAYASLFEIVPADGSTVQLTAVNPASVFAEPGLPTPITESEPILGLDGTSYFVVGANLVAQKQGLFQNLFTTTTERVIDISGQGVDVDTSAVFGGFPTGVALDDTITASVRHPFSTLLRRLHRFDPGAGVASQPITVDLGDADPNVFATGAAFGPNGEVYYLVTDGAIMPQQGVWRLDGGALTEVVDLTALGIELTFPISGQMAFGVAADGTLRTLTPLAADPNVWKLYRLDPSDGSATVLATLDLSLVFPSPVEPRSVAFGPDGTPYLLLFDSSVGPPVQQSIYRESGGVLVEVSDLTAQGIEISIGSPGVMLRSAVTTDGILLVMDGDFMSFSIRRVHAIDVGSGAAALQSIVDERGFVCCRGPSAGSAIVPAFAPNGDVFLIATGDSAAIDPQQQVYAIRQVPEPTATALGLSALVMLALFRLRAGTSKGAVA